MKLNKLANKFKAILTAGYYDTTKDVRQLFNLGKKYPKDAHAEGILPDGRKVRLLTTDQAKNEGINHRLQVECRYCSNWIPAGRWHQHYDSCRLKNDPSFKDMKKQIMQMETDYGLMNDGVEKFELAQVIIDLYETYDPEKYANKIKWLRGNAYISLAKYYMKKEFGSKAFMTTVPIGTDTSHENMSKELKKGYEKTTDLTDVSTRVYWVIAPKPGVQEPYNRYNSDLIELTLNKDGSYSFEKVKHFL